VGFFRDFQESTAIILSKLNHDMFPLDLQFAGGQNIFHI
jgi:hypothetical protein